MINDPEFKPDAEVATNVLRLMPNLHVSEDAALFKAREILSGLSKFTWGRLHQDGYVLRMGFRASKTQSDGFLPLFSNTSVPLTKGGTILPIRQHILFKIFFTRTRYELFVGSILWT